MSLKSAAKRIINRVTGRQLRRAQEEDRKLLAISTRFPQERIENAHLLTDRDELLRRLPSGGTVAEVGVARGEFTERILELNKPSKLYLIDAWMMNSESDYGTTGMAQVESRFLRAIDSGLVEIRRGWSWDRLEELEDQSLDWVYIDAAHDYEAVKKDLVAVRPKVKPGGYICGHDYVRWARHGNRFGVVEAVNEFSMKNGYRLEYLTFEPDYNPSFAIRCAS